MVNILCRVFGHRLETGVHARRATLFCSRCQRVIWTYYEEVVLILNSDTTIAELKAMGVGKVTP